MHIYTQNQLTRRWNLTNVNGHQVLEAHWSGALDNGKSRTQIGEDSCPFFHLAA